MLNKLKLDEGLGHYIPIKQVYLYLAGILTNHLGQLVSHDSWTHLGQSVSHGLILVSR